MLGPNKQNLVAGRAWWQVRPGGRRGLEVGRAWWQAGQAGKQARPGGRQGKRRSQITGKWPGRSRAW